MKYLSVSHFAKKWNLTDRSVRKYCADGKIPGAFMTGKTWNIPEDSDKPLRLKRKSEKLKTFNFKIYQNFVLGVSWSTCLKNRFLNSLPHFTFLVPDSHF